jgi:hypothetical protein
LNKIVVSEESIRRNPEEEVEGGAFFPFSGLSASAAGTVFKFKGAEVTAATCKVCGSG